MSQDIWTECGGAYSVRELRLAPWRVVEAQHINSTRKLVDSDDEQALLELLIDDVKPRSPFPGLHHLLATPFRYPPLRYGSRFGTRSERGIWYGARRIVTALAELAYYRLLFLEGTSADLSPLTTWHSVFQAHVATSVGIDLTALDPPDIASPTTYAASQALGAAMRAAGVEAFLYPSARDPAGGDNVGLFEPCFTRRTPSTPVSWVCVSTREAVEVKRADLHRQERHRFVRSIFEVDGQLPVPGVLP